MNRKTSSIVRIFLLFVLLMNLAVVCKGVHQIGADLSYVPVGNNQYAVTLRVYRDCCGIAPVLTESIELYNGCAGTVFSTFTVTRQANPGNEVRNLCAAAADQSTCAPTNCPANPTGNPAAYPGMQVYVYNGMVTLPTLCNQWYLRYSSCCRDNNLNNIAANGSTGMGVQALINNTLDPQTNQSYNNNSAFFSRLPLPFICTNYLSTYSYSAVDADGDSLYYAMVNPLDENFNPVSYRNGWSLQYPVRTNNLLFDSLTGILSFSTGYQEVDVLAVQVNEYRNQVLVGSSMRDIQLSMFPCTLSIPRAGAVENISGGRLIDSAAVQTCPGTSLKFDIPCTNANNTALSASCNINDVPSAVPGAVFTTTGAAGNLTAHIEWTPQVADTGCYYFNVAVTNADCPITASYDRVYRICVQQQLILQASDTVFCGDALLLSATGGSNFTWQPSQGPNAVAFPDSVRTTAAPQSPTFYYFTSSCGADSVFIDTAPRFNFNIYAPDTFCSGSLIQLHASADSLFAPYRFKWTGGHFLDTSANLRPDTLSNPFVLVHGTQTYSCEITASNGCRLSGTVLVRKADDKIYARAEVGDTCNSDTFTLIAAIAPAACGLGIPGCLVSSTTIQVGNALNQTPPSSATQYPTIYGHFAKSARHQFLYQASELAAQVTGGGQILSLGFNLSQINAFNDTIQNFEIKIGCTQQTALATWETNVVTVYAPRNIAIGTTVGWRNYILDTPYNWDGTSNLVVEVCFNNDSGGVLNSKMRCTPTSFNSVFYSFGAYEQCGHTGTPRTSINRPNTRFSICTAAEPLVDSTLVWEDENLNMLGTTAAIRVLPDSSSKYYVTLLAPCTIKDSIIVNRRRLPLISLANDTAACGMLQLSVGGNFDSYIWQNVVDSTEVANVAEALILNSGTYTVTGFLTSGCKSADTISVLINPSPAVSLLLTADTLCNGEHQFALTGGSPAGGIYSGNMVANNIFYGNDPGQYDIEYTYTDSNGCVGVDMQTITVLDCTGLNGKDEQHRPYIYPNPSRGSFYLKRLTAGSRISIYNAQGRQVFNAQPDVTTYMINFLNQPAGVYLVKIENSEGTHYTRLQLLLEE